MPSEVPTLEEFLRSCRAEFQFLVDDFGFLEAPCSERERFCVRFQKDDRSLEIRGEGYGTTAACDLYVSDKTLSLIYLVPESSLPKRSRKRDEMGQLDHVREWAELAREHAGDFFGGDVERFVRVYERHRRGRSLLDRP